MKKYAAATLLIFICLLTATATVNGLVTVETNVIFAYENGYTLTLVHTTTTFFENATNNGVWVNFTNLSLNGGIPANFYIKIENTNISLTALDLTKAVTYNVASLGTQIFNAPIQPTYVQIDGHLQPNGYGWTYTDGFLTVNGATETVRISFTSIPPDSQVSVIALGIYGSLAIAGLIPMLMFALIGIIIFKVQGEINYKQIIGLLILAVTISVLCMVGVLIWSSVERNLTVAYILSQIMPSFLIIKQ